MFDFLQTISDLVVAIWINLWLAIFVHECGHAAAVLWCRVHLSHFEVGSGWPALSFRLMGSRITLRPVPSTGFVRSAFASSTRVDRIRIYAAGPLANAAAFFVGIVAGWSMEFLLMQAFGFLLNAYGQDGQQARRELRILRRNRKLARDITGFDQRRPDGIDATFDAISNTGIAVVYRDAPAALEHAFNLSMFEPGTRIILFISSTRAITSLPRGWAEVTPGIWAQTRNHVWLHGIVPDGDSTLRIGMKKEGFLAAVAKPVRDHPARSS